MRLTAARVLTATALAFAVVGGVVAPAGATPIALPPGFTLPTGASDLLRQNGLASDPAALSADCLSGNRAAVRACTDGQELSSLPPAQLAADPANTAIVVLGARLTDDGGMWPVLQARLETARALALRFPGAPVIVSGGATNGGWVEAHAMRLWLVAGGVAPERIHQEDRSRDTVENARFSGDLLRRISANAAVVVTSPAHMRRALVEFRTVLHGAMPVYGVTSDIN